MPIFFNINAQIMENNHHTGPNIIDLHDQVMVLKTNQIGLVIDSEIITVVYVQSSGMQKTKVTEHTVKFTDQSVDTFLSHELEHNDDDIDDNNVKKQDGTTNHMITDNNNDNSSQTPTPPPPTPTLLTTPLCTLTHLLHQSHTNHQLTRQLFRTSHSLHLHASTQKAKAVEAYKLAQAELEHATTAEEFALQELQRARVKKEEASNVYGNLKRQVGKLAGGYKGARVTLVNLQTNSNWNGRVGTIVKLITEGVEEEDVGRWKVRLDGDWRGKEPDGNYEYGKRYLMLL